MIVNTNLIKKRYDEMLYDSRPVKFSEYMTNKYNIIHNKLYINALNAFINDWLNAKRTQKRKPDESYEDYIQRCENFIKKNPNMKYCCGKVIFNVDNINDFKKYSSIFEIMPDEYWKSSKIKIITKGNASVFSVSNNLTWEVDLSKYWNQYQKFSDKNLDIIKYEKETYNDAAVINLNYIKGIATLYSKNNDYAFNVPFEYLDENTPVSEQYMLNSQFSNIFNK